MNRLEHLEDDRAGAVKKTRRSFISWFSVGALAVCAGVMTLFNLIFLKPRVSQGAASKFRIGKPENYASGSVVEMKEAKVVVRRDGNRIAAISTICTHLGCTVNSTDVGFECPCHGSIYDLQGDVVAGPAPEPLAWYRVGLTPSGELEIDKQSVVDAGTYLEVEA
ncbi:MAG: ubiquinol-cytochrome c reductase iron-sulfur subunit [Planctomycetota bacterium]|nr:ubiquinol-cytochrome c reductase iron-sulfur subunit [Planctomycetota bacterium]